MASFEAFVNWAKDRFGEDNIIVKGHEVKINSIFADDTKHHLWCNPYGGKGGYSDGVYRCFYTEHRGTLVGLIMLVDSCSLDEARRILGGETPFWELEAKLDAIFSGKADEQPLEPAPLPAGLLKLPEYCFRIAEMPRESTDRMSAEDYLTSRKLPSDSLYYCTAGQFRQRIIIPYLDREGRLIYYNGRTIGKSALRYLGPDKACGIGKADVLYLPKWPKPGSKVYLTEGEFDALTLYLCGLYGCACGGKSLSDKQTVMLRDYKVCVALDADSAGRAGLTEMGKMLRGLGVNEVSFVRPPKGRKDWNTLYMEVGKEVLSAYIRIAEKEFDIWGADMLELSGW
jgi:hypothetical protein